MTDQLLMPPNRAQSGRARDSCRKQDPETCGFQPLGSAFVLDSEESELQRLNGLLKNLVIAEQRLSAHQFFLLACPV